MNPQRRPILNWDDYFMGLAFLSGMKSEDPNTKVGACIVNTNRIVVGLGYNGLPRSHNDNNFQWYSELRELYVVHAATNAILNKNTTDLRNCRLYTSLFPCNECAKLIIQSGITEVIYMSDNYFQNQTTIASKEMFTAAGVIMTQFRPRTEAIVFNFSGDIF